MRKIFIFIIIFGNLSSPTRDWTQAQAVKALSFNHWTATEFQEKFLDGGNTGDEGSGSRSELEGWFGEGHGGYSIVNEG